MQGTWVLITMLIVSSFPVIAVYAWFRFAKYPISPVKFLLALLVGAAAIFPAIIFQNILYAYSPTSGRAALFYNFFFRIAFTEELSRLILLFIFFWVTSLISASKENSQPLSWGDIKMGAALGLTAGLGFAILENAIYTAAKMDINLLLLRAVTAAPLHAACGSRVGSAAVMLRTNPVQSILRLLTAVAIHGIYNLMVTMPGFSVIMAILIAFSALITAILSIKGSWNEPNTENAVNT